jgi:fumarate reductase flavoprotein subunit
VSDRTGFEISPTPIHPRDIKEEITTDVVIVGAGIAGLTAAVSATESGAKTLLLEKGPTLHQRGGHNAAIASRLQKQSGITIDRNQIIATIMEHGGYRCDQRVITTWADNCNQVMDWLLDMAATAKIEVILDPATKSWYFPNYPTIHIFMPNMQETLANMLQDKARAAGVDFRFETPAVRLLRDGKDRVSAVIGQTKSGDYIKVNVNRAVVLCTGDYGHDRQMVRKYCWESVNGLKCHYDPPVNTGDGHKIGMWIGAAIDDPPHCVMLFDWAVWSEEGLFNIARQPWLYVNLQGERFMNEDLPYNYACNQILQQTAGLWWSVWDTKYSQEWPKMKSQCCKNMASPSGWWNDDWLESSVRKGNVLTAQTIEQLAMKMKVPVDPFRASILRYSQLARDGYDADFGKHPDRLTTIEKPPFYACKMEVRYMVTLGGLKINSKLQVLDTDKNIIPGLYAAGNVSGSFFGQNYPTTVPGLTHSRAWTFGRLAGLSAAKETW